MTSGMTTLEAPRYIEGADGKDSPGYNSLATVIIWRQISCLRDPPGVPSIETPPTFCVPDTFPTQVAVATLEEYPVIQV